MAVGQFHVVRVLVVVAAGVFGSPGGEDHRARGGTAPVPAEALLRVLVLALQHAASIDGLVLD